MKRDFDLIRKIILEIRAVPAKDFPVSLDIPGYDVDEYFAHMELLIEAGFIKATVIKSLSGISDVAVLGMTWKGHDFAENAESESIWKEAFKIIKSKGIEATFDLLFEILKKLTHQAGALG